MEHIFCLKSGQDLEKRATNPQQEFPVVQPPRMSLSFQIQGRHLMHKSSTFSLRCCITKRLLEKRETQQISKPIRIRSMICQTRHAVTSRFCLNHHMYKLCGLTVLTRNTLSLSINFACSKYLHLPSPFPGKQF